MISSFESLDVGAVDCAVVHVRRVCSAQLRRVCSAQLSRRLHRRYRRRGFAGLAPSPASGERIGGMPFTSEIRAWLSCRLAPDIPTDMGSPDRSVIRPIFEP
ncbi:hypothetical protein IQ60_35445 [Streptomyces europaeiscabiei]|nr:hypothetical protein IQ60_35445 [Streptomyces europaeiscabiei]